MSINVTNTLAALTALMSLQGVMVPAVVAEQGQYRSRVQLTPPGQLGHGSELSIKELEQQIGSIELPYAQASAGRHLARYYVESGDYVKAVKYYEDALAAEGLSPVANREMLRELAQVYLLTKNYSMAAVTLERAMAFELVAQVTDYLLLAQAYYRMSDYVAVVETLDQLDANSLTLDTAQMQQALALYYRAGAFAQSEALLQQLLEREPGESRHWHLLASVYLQQNKNKQALDQLTLARSKAVPFSPSEVLLLVDLQAVNHDPYGAAATLAAALADQELETSAANYRKLFEFWFQAREQDRAMAALRHAASKSGDTELYLYLAQLQMEHEDWPGMRETLLAACTEPLVDRFVGRANLLFGVSQFKLGDAASARRSFINATLIGGVNAQAAQWLKFINAAPPTEDELRRIAGVCHGAGDKALAAADTADASIQQDALADFPASDMTIKTVPAQHLFYAEYDAPVADIGKILQSQAVRLHVSLVKAGGSADGPMQVILPAGLLNQPTDARWQLGVPTRGSVTARGRFRVRAVDSFRCASRTIDDSVEDLRQAFIDFAMAVQAAGHEADGESRILMLEMGDNGTMSIELQLGIQ